MNITFKQKVAVATCSILGLGGLGVGSALAQASPKSTPAVQALPSTNAVPGTTAGPDTDTVQQRNQTTPDTAAEAAGDKADAPEAPEPPEAPEAGGANHQDRNGVNVDYTPVGEAPEAS